MAIVFLFAIASHAQKKPLDHTVYDQWQSITEKTISNNGKYVTYTINPQEGDGILVLQSADGSYRQEIARGYNAVISNDSRFVICRIKPLWKDTREARIKKKKPEDMPKDSLAIAELGTGRATKVARVKSYKQSDETGTWLAYLLEKTLPEAIKPSQPDSLTKINTMLAMADSLAHMADSIRNKVNTAREKGMNELKPLQNNVPQNPVDEAFEEGTDLVLRNLATGETKTFNNVSEYFFSKKGNVLVLETTRKNNDPQLKATVVRVDLFQNKIHTILSGFNDAKGYRFDESGSQLAFVAERDSSSKSLQKFYRLYYYKEGADTAAVVADRNTKGMPVHWTVSDNPNIVFSKSGARLFFGTAPILPVKDTSLPEFERVNLDIWHYNDDYIQPVQLKNLDNELKRSYMARMDLANNKVIQLATDKMRVVVPTGEGDGDLFYGTADFGKRVATQWQGFGMNDVYIVNPENGTTKLVHKDLKGAALQPSYSGKYLLFYDERKQHYFIYNANNWQLYPVATDIQTKLYDEENDVPDDANAYGVVKWMEGDHHVLIYDRYDIWKVDAEGKAKSVRLTDGRKDRIRLYYVNTDAEERFIKNDQQLLLRLFDEKDKTGGLALLNLGGQVSFTVLFKEPKSLGFSPVLKAKDASVLCYTRESYTESPNLYVQPMATVVARKLSDINPQQSGYNWGTAELFKWKSYTGKETEGILYKPEDFDPHKKYPMIVYFYERNNNTLYNYQPPSPTPSRLNIPFFVSRGYVVLVPDIWYTKGHPGQSAYDYILSGTRAVVRQGFVDSTKIGLQGQSWGGYQIVYLITKTNLYAAAWAGAPVANMTSAYGGIRWGTGLNRQFQYEKSQSRIGATLWEKPELYLQNSALFSLPKVTTPLVIMANDADDAVPWYQGIEMYTGMRRLGKKVWMLNYNNEAHNLVERKNRKDIQIREQQFFDYLLKGEKPAKWIAEGVPAVMKGRDWGLGD